MSGPTVADLLADLLDAGATPANAAKVARTRDGIGAAGDGSRCEGSRIPANLARSAMARLADSQTFASHRNPPDAPQSKQWRGSSQDSQASQGLPATEAPDRRFRLTPADADAAHAKPWEDAAIAQFVARVGLFLRRGLHATDTDDLAERLHLRDLRQDDRAMCLECAHYRPGRCGNHDGACLTSPDVGRDIAAMLQRCPGFKELPELGAEQIKSRGSR